MVSRAARAPEIDAPRFLPVPTWPPISSATLRSQLQVGNLRDFERFTRAAALRTSQMLNRAEMARDVGVAPSTAGQCSRCWNDPGSFRCSNPGSNRGKSLVKSPKLHFQDAGLCAFLMGIGSVEDLLDSPLAGALWETMVFSNCSDSSLPADIPGSSPIGATAPRRPISCSTAPERSVCGREVDRTPSAPAASPESPPSSIPLRSWRSFAAAPTPFL